MTYNRKNHEQCFSPMILTTYIVLLVFVKKLSDFEKFYEFGVFKKKGYENMIPLNKDSLIKIV